MIEKTQAGEGVREKKIYYNRQIRDIVTSDNVATVTLILRETSHKLKLVKSNPLSKNWLITFDELQYISHSTGRFLKKIAPCGDGIRFLED